MIAKNIISNSVFPLSVNDTADEALSMMSLYRLKELPVVENKKLIGILTENEAFELNPDDSIGPSLQNGNVISVTEGTHLIELISKMATHKLSMIPVLVENEYSGLITQDDMFNFYANSFSFKEIGSILVIEVSRKEYSMVEISQIIESERAAILSSFLSDASDISRIVVTLKINKLDIQTIISSCERYGYEIKASFTEEEYVDNLKERYDLLMHYLNV